MDGRLGRLRCRLDGFPLRAGERLGGFVVHRVRVEQLRQPFRRLVEPSTTLSDIR
ncbi:MAG TPA: hypothetical protein VEK78_04665 [Gemmatimonadales bacterium]|nr:hypothetical protein [Gemmatimonadales bacterium]HYT82261.1 hypothetical protein [Gemmatimonadales bacterium]